MLSAANNGICLAIYYDNPDQLREIDSYIELLRGQDDRSCVVMIAARIEALLESVMDRTQESAPPVVSPNSWCGPDSPTASPNGYQRIDEGGCA